MMTYDENFYLHVLIRHFKMSQDKHNPTRLGRLFPFLYHYGILKNSKCIDVISLLLPPVEYSIGAPNEKCETPCQGTKHNPTRLGRVFPVLYHYGILKNSKFIDVVSLLLPPVQFSIRTFALVTFKLTQLSTQSSRIA